jgi:lipoprotein-releasing system ATP-binding protein
MEQLSSNSPLLRAEHLVKSYSSAHEAASGERTQVLRGVSLEVLRGEMLAIVGSSGAGKSTLLHLLGALDEPDEGTIELFLPAESSTNAPTQKYADLNSDALATLRNRHIGFIFQFHHLLPEFTALENVMMPALIAGVPTKEASARAHQLLENVGVAHRLHHKPDALSGGEQQRVSFARAHINNPAIVFADEPTGNVDGQNSALLLEQMRRFSAERNQTYVIVTHSTELAAAAHRTLRLEHGLLV